MSNVEKSVKALEESGIYCAEKVEKETITLIFNMAEWHYYDIDIMTLESYLGILAQQVMYLQQEVNKAEAHETEKGNIFKINALPLVIDSKIRSVEERWIFASTLSEELEQQFADWQQATIEATLRKRLSEPMVEKLQVLKKIYDDRRMEGKNKNLHKYVEGQQ